MNFRIIKRSRRFRDVVIDGPLPSRRMVPVAEVAGIIREIREYNARENLRRSTLDKRHGGTFRSYVRGFKGRKIVGPTAGMAASAKRHVVHHTSGGVQ